jgi:prevent-host-death family protein
MVFSDHEAKTQFSKLLDLACKGEEVVITRRGKTVAKLVAANDESKKIPFDSMKGEFSWKESWEKAMTDEEVDAFWDGRW